MATLSRPEITKSVGKDIGASARAVYDAINKRDLDKAVAQFADDCEYVEIGLGRTYRGPSEVRENLSGWLRAFPDALLEVTNVVANGDVVAVEYTARGTHSGPLVGPDGSTLAATGRRAETAFCDVLNMRNGKIVRGRSYYDAGSLLRQLGATPGSGAAQLVNRKPGEGTPLWMLGGLYTIKASSKETNGELSVLEMLIPPGGQAPPHIHECGEAALVLEGSIRWHVGDDAVDAGAGQFLYFPKGTLEWLENVSSEPARLLTIYAPGGMDEFFAEAAEPAKKRELPPRSDTPPDVARLMKIAERHGLKIKEPTST
ncbi:MAG: ester cyclase [Deltaproteobacteria bacterium]|nr:ester cyclase [Deltaproteobacteria bacterium]